MKKNGAGLDDVLPAGLGDEIGAQGVTGGAKNKHKIRVQGGGRGRLEFYGADRTLATWGSSTKNSPGP